jgi:hypothetical protein
MLSTLRRFAAVALMLIALMFLSCTALKYIFIGLFIALLSGLLLLPDYLTNMDGQTDQADQAK